MVWDGVREPPLVWALERIVNEGSASMVDKAGYIRTGTIPPGFPPEFLELVAGTPERMAAIDEALATFDPTPEGYEAAAEVVSGASPWGGHRTGVYMAMAIEEAFGAEGVVEAFGGPSAFFVRYQEAVEELGGEWFRFSDGAMEGVRGAWCGRGVSGGTSDGLSGRPGVEGLFEHAMRRRWLQPLEGGRIMIGRMGWAIGYVGWSAC